jgi:hypothetical protein
MCSMKVRVCGRRAKSSGGLQSQVNSKGILGFQACFPMRIQYCDQILEGFLDVGPT